MLKAVRKRYVWVAIQMSKSFVNHKCCCEGNSRQLMHMHSKDKFEYFHYRPSPQNRKSWITRTMTGSSTSSSSSCGLSNDCCHSYEHSQCLSILCLMIRTYTHTAILRLFVQDYLVGRYKKRHSPIHTWNHHPSFISLLHLPRFIASSLFNPRALQSLCTTSVQVLLDLYPLGLQGAPIKSIP